jgi:hypothetical protein
MRKMQIRNPSDAYKRLLAEVKDESFVVLHIRLGDYLSEPAFGTPDFNYYTKGLAKLHSQLGEIKVLGFSDQPELAQELLSKVSNAKISWVTENGLSSAETLDIMRHGQGYLIANSTFSWWAATLRHNEEAPVYAPSPWFKAMEEPHCLVPHDWVRLMAYTD